ncbi:MAG TPA: peroxidase-related enzyme [Pseudonocardiaceae bacterium]|jgi:uncharacterized peroxidase-related enzyme|nr:peroxidase-related enzyme [Pseudonocardiaceae bacterium]
MPHIPLSPDLPGITGALAFKPALGAKFSAFTQELMRGPSTLSEGERELIAAYVSAGNDCYFCTNAHAGAARHTLGDDGATFTAVCANLDSAPVSERLRALLIIADKVRQGGRSVTEEDIARARTAGADDEQLHDTVFIAAAFCMANRYVDGLATVAPRDPAVYDLVGKRLATEGYLNMAGRTE